MRSRSLYRPLAPAVAILFGLLITPTWFPWIPWQAVVPVCAVLGYLIYNPGQTVRGLVAAFNTVFPAQLDTLLSRSAFTITCLSMFSYIYIATRFGLSWHNSPAIPAVFLLISMYTHVIYLAIAEIRYSNQKKEENLRYQEMVRRLLWINLKALPFVGVVLGSVALMKWIFTKAIPWAFSTLLKKIGEFVVLFIRKIHSEPRIVCLFDSSIGFMVSYRLFVQELNLETMRYLIGGMIVGYMLGLGHNLLADWIKSTIPAKSELSTT